MQIGVTVKKTKKICDEILERFGDGEYLRHISTGKGEYPDQATFWRWRQKDRELAEQFMSSLIKNGPAVRTGHWAKGGYTLSALVCCRLTLGEINF